MTVVFTFPDKQDTGSRVLPGNFSQWPESMRRRFCRFALEGKREVFPLESWVHDSPPR